MSYLNEIFSFFYDFSVTERNFQTIFPLVFRKIFRSLYNNISTDRSSPLSHNNLFINYNV